VCRSEDLRYERYRFDLVGADTSRTLLHAFELLALLPQLGGRRSLRLGALRRLTASFGRGDFGGDFFYG